MKERARAVVIGGGVGGCAILYWLARLGWSDILLVERADLTSGSTFHSAGLVGQLRSSLSLTRMMMESVELYRTLGTEVGLETGWREVGSLRLASSEERMEEIVRQAGWAKTVGLPLELVSAAEAQELFPPMSVEGVLGAAYLPSDGYVDPSQLTFALAEGARRRGAEIATQTRVTGIATERGRVTAVETDRGTIETEVVVNAGGMFAGELGALAGVTVPVVPIAHEYLVLKPSGLPLDMPTMRDPSLLVYFRPESGGLIMGGYERHCAPWSLDGIPADFNGKLLEEDWPRFEELMENAIVRVPSLEEMEVVRLVNGPEAFTPDGEFVLGPSDMRGFWVAAGFCAHGLAGAGGMGKLVAEWIVEGTPSLDVWHMDSRRFGAAHRSQAYTLARTKEVYETYYDVKYPGHERSAGRPLRVSATYARLAELGAVFGEKAGWERANWFEPNAAAGDESLRPRGWAGKLWSAAIGAEHVACRERAALFDESSFAKLDVSGEGAAAFLEGLCANRVARDVGRVTYTQMLNERGGIECDFTVTRLADDRFRIVTGTAFGQHDLAWIRQHAPDDGSVHVADVTSQYACLGLWGPAAREILQPLTRADLATSAFPYMTAQAVAVGPVPCLAVRVTYVGELGGSSTAPPSTASRSGTRCGRPAGSTGSSRAATGRSTRCGSRRATACGARTSRRRRPRTRQASASSSARQGEFVGRPALAAAGEPERRLRCLVLADPRSIALGSEPVRVAGSLVGRVTSGGFGYTVGSSIAYAYLPAEHDVGTEVAVEIFGELGRGRGGGGAALRPGRRAGARVTPRRGGRAPRVARRPLELRGARRRHHEPQPEGDAGPTATFVLRIAGKDTELLGIDRSVELEATRAAAAVGVGPDVVDFVQPEGWLVTRFVEGEIPPLERMREPSTLRRVAATLRAIHSGPPVAGRFNAFRIVEDYRTTAFERGAEMPSGYVTARQVARRIEHLRRAAPERPCHNDLLNANFIDDGHRLRIVDWEYAGMGDVFFDLANFSVNHELDEDARDTLLEAYVGTLRAGDRRVLELMRFMSDFREAMWGVVQAAVSELDFDFAAYADEHFARLARTAAEPSFQAALAGP